MTTRTKKSNLDSAEMVSSSTAQVPRTFQSKKNSMMKIKAHLFEPEKLDFDNSELHQGFKIINSSDKDGKPLKYGQAKLLYSYPSGEKGPLNVEFSRLKSTYSKIVEKKQTLRPSATSKNVEPVEVMMKELTLALVFDHPDDETIFPKSKYFPDYNGCESITLKELIHIQTNPIDGFYAKLKERLIQLLNQFPLSKKYIGTTREEQLSKCNLEPDHPKDKYTSERQTHKPLCKFVSETAYAYAMKKDTLEDIQIRNAKFTFPIKGQPTKQLVHEDILNSELDLMPLMQFQFVRCLDKTWNCKGQISSAIVYDIIPVSTTDLQADSLREAEEEQDQNHTMSVLATIEARRQALNKNGMASNSKDLCLSLPKLNLNDTDFGDEDEDSTNLRAVLDSPDE